MTKKVGEVITAEQAARQDKARAWWAIFVCVICTGVVVVLGVLYVNQVQRQSEQKWCGLVVTLDDSYAAPRPPGSPPITPTGKRLMDEMHRLRTEFHC